MLEVGELASFLKIFLKKPFFTRPTPPDVGCSREEAVHVMTNVPILPRSPPSLDECAVVVCMFSGK